AASRISSIPGAERIAAILQTSLAGVVLVVVAVWMFSRRQKDHGIGLYIASGSLFFYGIHQLHDLAYYTGVLRLGTPQMYGHWLAYGDFLLQVLVGFGMVSSLLEEERRAAYLATQQIEHVAYHDALTGLPNRPLFLDRLIVALAQAARHDFKIAIFFLDVDHFKDINDTLGHSHGDALLKELADRIRKCVRAGDTVSRFGGDEFTIFAQHVERVEDIARIAQKLLDAVKQPFRVGDHELFVSVSVGISFYPLDGSDPETLLKNADAAMYRAKEQGRDNYQIYAPAMNACAIERLSQETQLRHALENGELEVHYQPLVELESGTVYGAEALLRWRRPDGRLATPRTFMRTLEASGLIVPVGDWVLHRACLDAVEWSEAEGARISVAVNLAARQFQRPNLAERVAAVLAETGLEASRLELEITESCAMQSAEASVRTMRELKRAGVRIAIDDFGTGYSSLHYLKRFPIDTLKLDRSFVQDVTENSDDAAIATVVVSMAASLGLKLVAEGIETPEQLAFFRERRCTRGQGFLFGRPMAADEFRAFLRERARPPIETRVAQGAL
ncbi:MAG TPA: EAL domain-containing protein, partial [Thermoanaerobaculia bacterium]|nr:EAL domain-containing protein [Thermoanaerobaculia bacterium]